MGKKSELEGSVRRDGCGADATASGRAGRGARSAVGDFGADAVSLAG
jgi:hypothetical protein